LSSFLLLEGRQPRRGSFYLANGGALPEEPTIPAFAFDENAFKGLPESTGDPTAATSRTKRLPHKIPWVAVASIGLLLFLIGLWTFGSSIAQALRPNSNQVGLSVFSAGSNLKISWDHSAPIISKAVAANLVITDGRGHHEVRLDSDDLRLGQVVYQRVGKKVYIIMQLDTPGFHSSPQTFDWNGD
jgi:hypothetical protein